MGFSTSSVKSAPVELWDASLRQGLESGLAGPRLQATPVLMQEIKDTRRALVRIGYDGVVHKTFRGHEAAERFANEVRVLQHLEARGCNFVPRLLSQDPATLQISTTNCGQRVENISPEKLAELFAELETYGVRHEDADIRNVTYSRQLGRFCLIDFEFATLLDDPHHRSPLPFGRTHSEPPVKPA